MIYFFLSHTSFHRPTVCSRLPRFCLSNQLQHYSLIFLTKKKTVADMLAPAGVTENRNQTMLVSKPEATVRYRLKMVAETEPSLAFIVVARTLV